MRSGEDWEVRREAKPQGRHSCYDSALMSALFMASIDGERSGHGAEVFVEDEVGHLILERTMVAGDQVALSLGAEPNVIRLGVDAVLAPA